MFLNKIIQIILLILVTSSTIKAQVNAEKTANIISFADFLAKEQDYYRAITEYRRALFYLPDNRQKDSIEFKIGLCELKRGDFNTASSIFEKTWKKSEILGDIALKQLAYTHYLAGEYLKSLNIIDNSELIDITYLKGWNYIKLKQWDKAKTTF